MEEKKENNTNRIMNISDDKEIEEKEKQEEKMNSLYHPTFYILFNTHTLHSNIAILLCRWNDI